MYTPCILNFLLLLKDLYIFAEVRTSGNVKFLSYSLTCVIVLPHKRFNK